MNICKQAVLSSFVTASLVAASLPVSKPEDVGLSAERLKRIHPLIQSHIDAKDLAGAVTPVARKGKVIPKGVRRLQ